MSTARKVIAGPAGHWYALDGEELIGLPISADADLTTPPLHPAQSGDYDGWYQITDPAPGTDADALIAELRA